MNPRKKFGQLSTIGFEKSSNQTRSSENSWIFTFIPKTRRNQIEFCWCTMMEFRRLHFKINMNIEGKSSDGFQYDFRNLWHHIDGLKKFGELSTSRFFHSRAERTTIDPFFDIKSHLKMSKKVIVIFLKIFEISFRVTLVISIDDYRR